MGDVAHVVGIRRVRAYNALMHTGSMTRAAGPMNLSRVDRAPGTAGIHGRVLPEHSLPVP